LDQNALILTAAEYLGVVAVMMIAGLSPSLKRRRPLGFKYPMRDGRGSLSLFALILLMAFLVYIQFFTPIHADQLMWQRLVIAVIALLPFGAAMVIRGQPLRSAGWGRETIGLAFRIGLALAFLTIFLRGKIWPLIRGITPETGIALLVWLGIAAAEETIFRGYIQPRLSAWLGENYGLLATAALFGFWQLPHLLADPTTLVIRVGLVVLQGLILGWVMRKTGNVVAPFLYRAFSEWVGLL
jgi:membrane protease YdiL (CAAX protease family)